jgi:hypothetical protein
MRWVGVVCIAVSCLSVVAVEAAESEQEVQQLRAAEKQMEKVRDAVKRRDVNIRFFGRVIDQRDEPVGGAEVQLHVTRFSLNAEKLGSSAESVGRF